ncbi:transcriptional activator [Pseudogymnoascus verrucosus]|uniref:Transcriptional activator n=1 Tax=Pseudogymnoascus verrucosus TaxID=342668 RepID=A0A1B8GPS3_9PEZI|nr:transcriptional activator [Pseudogymnoascus verrucosus]OBT97827.1 transcriptional activator [Pseudogymnoascus verrucosus]
MNQQDAQMMQNYPDPTAVAAEGNGPFYASGNASQQQPQQQQPQPQQQQQQQTQRLSNPDDLQLAAQLSRGLEPMMGGGGGNDAAHSPQSNPNHGFSHEQQMMAEMSHAANMDHSQYQMGDGTTPRKRSKVSRACDECRRKKIRCDATTESGEEQCTSCKRVGTHCQFSRVPMKRGPSKGYIKELADRLNHLEGAMQNQSGEALHYPPHVEGAGSRRASHDYSPPPPHTEGQPRKRAYSSISQDFTSGYQSQRQSGQWQALDTPRHHGAPATTYGQANAAAESSYRAPLYSPNGLAPQPQWRNAPPEAGRASFDGLPAGEGAHGDHKLEWDEYISEEYYKTIQPTFPLLPGPQGNVAARLANAPPLLKDAFLEALYVAVRPPVDSAPTRRAASLVSACQFDNTATKTLSDSLLLLSAQIFMAIEAGSHGASSARSAGCQAVWLGAAVGHAFSLKLHTSNPAEGEDEDSTDKLSRRIWWSLVILDRFHASGTSSPLLIPDTSAVLRLDDINVLGEQLYHLARLSSILGHVATVLTSPPSLLAFPSSATPLLSTLLTGELERFRESLPAALTTATAPLMHLTYWHVQLLTLRATPGTPPATLLHPAVQITTLLAAAPPSPLHIHFTTLASATLLELLDNEATREEADRTLRSLFEGPVRTSAPWDKALRDLVARHTRAASPAAPSAAALTASQGLQHLADLATAGEAVEPKEGGTAVAAVSWDPATITRGGFLGVLGGEAR